MRIKLDKALHGDAPGIAALRTAVARTLTAQFGEGPWSAASTKNGVLFNIRNSTVLVARENNKPIASLTLCTKKPWSIDRKYFSACSRPLYLTAMAVTPDLQRQGIGRLCIEATTKIVKHCAGDAIRLDAYDAGAGAGEFYRKCGFREVGRASYRNVPLIYFEMLV